MKTELRPSLHQATGVIVYEIWYGGQMIATIYGADGPGVRVISKYPMSAADETAQTTIPRYRLSVTEIRIDV